MGIKKHQPGDLLCKCDCGNDKLTTINELTIRIPYTDLETLNEDYIIKLLQ